MFKNKRKRKIADFDVDTIFLDTKNLPVFDRSQMQGKIEQTISKNTIFFLGFVSIFILCALGSRVFYLQVIKGQVYSARALRNNLNQIPLFARRGTISDRNGELIVWNSLPQDAISTSKQNPAETNKILESIPDRVYTSKQGFGHLLGYVSYPKKDSKGTYWQTSFIGRDGMEKLYDTELSGKNGARLVEVDVQGNVLSNSLATEPTNGQPLVLTIDARMQDTLYESMQALAGRMGYRGGGAVIMDINNGDVLAFTSYPEYSSKILSEGKDQDTIKNYLTSSRSYFLNRIFQGAYTPGSIVKPFIALKALHDGVITANTTILSTGSISLPNPYDPANPTIFKDWRANGYTNLPQAIAVSSDVYFYEIGGGFGTQKGIGISNIDAIAQDFGLGKKVGITFPGEVSGTIPTPDWKAKNFDGDIWRLGDTYHSSIGQYGWQVTPLQMVRATAGLANFGKMVQPRLTFNDTIVSTQVKENISRADYQTVMSGMRLAVTDGTAKVLNLPYVDLAVKTGTAQVGFAKSRINSWLIGFFPYDHPKYAIVIMMEDAPSTASQSSSFAAKEFFDLLSGRYPELMKYLMQ